MKIRELLSDELTWTKGASGRTREGFSCLPDSVDAVRWCLSGAVERCYEGRLGIPIFGRIERALAMGEVMDWNDAPERTFAEVKALVDTLDI